MADEAIDLTLEKQNSISSLLPNEDLDLMVKDGDLDLAVGVTCIKESIMRRLLTPLGFNGILVGGFDSSGNKVVNRINYDYGSKLGQQLSEPITADWIRAFIAILTDTIKEEPLVSLSDIQVDSIDPSTGTVNFIVNYDIPANGSIDTLSIQAGISSLKIS
jgi:hypothetical protein